MKKRRFISVISAVAIVAAATFSLASCADKKAVNSGINQASINSFSQQEAINKRITLEKAIEIAISDAEITREEAKFKETATDSDNKIPHYDIDFVAGNIEYEYEISVADGKIIKKSTDTDSAVPESNNKPSVAESKQDKTNTSSSYIGVDEAKNAALNDSGVNAEDAKFEKAEFDSDDIIPHYDIEFHASGYKYDYEIKAADGSILEKDKERKLSNKLNLTPTEEDPSYIGKDTAKAKALSHAGLSADSIKNFSIKLDADDTIVHYEIEFKSGQFDYEYEINAKNGNIIASDKEIND